VNTIDWLLDSDQAMRDLTDASEKRIQLTPNRQLAFPARLRLETCVALIPTIETFSFRLARNPPAIGASAIEAFHARKPVAQIRLNMHYCFRAQAVMKLHVVTTPVLRTTSSRSRSARLSMSTSAAVTIPCSTRRGKMVRTSPAMYS
jgi:hypothetical protein